MADKTVTDADIAETLRAAGIDPSGASNRSLSTADDIGAVLRAAGIDATVSDKGLSFKEGGFNDTPEERAAIRQNRAVKKTTPPVGPFPEPEPSAEVKELAKRRGLTGQVISGIPIGGPVLNRIGAAGAAALEDQPPTFGERYSGNLERTQQADKWYARENPASSFGANMLGGALGYGPLSALKVGGAPIGGMITGTRGPTLASKLWTGIPGNAAISATDASLRGEDPVAGGIIGAAGGLAGPVVGEGFRGGTNLISNYLWPRAGLENFNTGAVNKLTGALSGETPASIAAGRDRMGPHGFLGDVSTGFTDIAGGLADTPGAHKATVREAYRLRDVAARDRITATVDKAAGPPTDPVAWEKMTTQARAAAADPLYDQFRTTKIHPTDEIKALIPRLEEAGAFGLANKLAGINGEDINMKFFTTGSKKDFPTAQTWDYVKRGLDQSIEQAYSSGNKTVGSALVKLKRDLLSEIKKAPGGQIYEDARQTFADHSDLLDARTAGRDTLLGSRSGLSKFELADEWKTLSAPEKKARVMGLRDAIDEAMGDTLNGDTTTRNKLLAPNNQDKMRLMLGKAEADGMIKDLGSEKFLKEQSQNVVHGTQTTPKKERVDALKKAPLPEYNPSLVEPLSLIPPHVRQAARPSTVIDAWRGLRNDETMNQLARAVTMPEGPKLNDLIAALTAEAQRSARVSASGQRAGNLLSGAITGPGAGSYRRRRAMSDDERR